MTSNDKHPTAASQSRSFYVMPDNPYIAEFKAMYNGELKVRKEDKERVQAKLNKIFGGVNNRE